MTDEEFKKQKDRVEALKKKWCRPIGLNWWQIDLVYHRGETQPDDINYAPIIKNGRFVTLFSVSTDFYYQQASIAIYTDQLQDVSDERLERYFVHELMHIFLKPMQRTGDEPNAKEEELVATQLANALIWWGEECEEKTKRVKK